VADAPSAGAPEGGQDAARRETATAAEKNETPTEEPVAPPAPIEPTDDIVEAWARWLDAGKGIPAGLTPFLRSAEVRDDGSGRLSIRPLPGPAYERLLERPVLDAIGEGLVPHLGRMPVLVVETPVEARDALARITPEAVREDTLKALFRQEPRLEQAVEELDLELMD
jgi:hypothetical protein